MATEGVVRGLEKWEKFALSFLKLLSDGVPLVLYGTKFKWLILLYKWYLFHCFYDEKSCLKPSSELASYTTKAYVKS